MDCKPAADQDLGPNSVLQQEIPWINYGLYKNKTKKYNKKKTQPTSQACIKEKERKKYCTKLCIFPVLSLFLL